MQRIAGRQLPIRIEVEPALAAGSGRSRIPRDAEGLQPPARHLHEILLQWRNAQREGDLELAGPAVRTRRANEEAIVAAQKGGDDPVLGKGRVVEVAQYGRAARMRHGMGMLRALPRRMLRLMACCAGVAPDEGRRGACTGRDRPDLGKKMRGAQAPDEDSDEQCNERPAGRHGASHGAAPLQGARRSIAGAASRSAKRRARDGPMTEGATSMDGTALSIVVESFLAVREEHTIRHLRGGARGCRETSPGDPSAPAVTPSA